MHYIGGIKICDNFLVLGPVLTIHIKISLMFGPIQTFLNQFGNTLLKFPKELVIIPKHIMVNFNYSCPLYVCTHTLTLAQFIAYFIIAILTKSSAY